MKKNILSVWILTSGILISAAIIGVAGAQTEPLLQPQEQKIPGDIQYPIPELGNCKSKNDCKAFCDDSKNVDACLAFAKQRNLMSPEELANAKKFQDTGMVGPGGCKGQTECEQYCGTSTHIEECTAFAEKNGMMSEQQLQDSKKVVAAIKSGLKPPACGGPAKCNAYCSNPLHMEECMAFSLAAGIVPENQKEQMQKTLDAIKQGVKPPACQPNPPSDQLGQSGQTNQSVNGLPTCNEYCSTHQEECMTFSLAAGMVPENQKEQMQKTLAALKQGIKPPACQPNPPDKSGQPSEPNQPGQSGGPGGPNEGQGFNPNSGVNGNGPGLNPDSSGQNNPNQPDQSVQGLQACDQYCADPSHVEECVKFSVAIGNMTEQQAQNAIKNGNKGPGGCVGRDACNTFCNNPDNEETCFNFAKDNGMISEENLQKMQEGQQKTKDYFSSIPPEVLDCLTSSVGADVVEKMKTGSVIGRTAGDSINQCFQKFGVEERTPNQNQNGQDQQNQNQPNQQIQPWADMCKPDENGNPTALACVDGNGKFVTSAKVGSDGNPVCPADSTAKCGNYQQNNRQQNQNNQQRQNQQRQQGQQGEDKFQPGPGTINSGGQQMPQQAGPGGCKGPEECKKYCASNPEVCKNFQPQQNQQGQSNQPGQRMPQQQPGQPNRQEQGGTNDATSPCGTGPGTCSGIGPDDINGNSGQGGPNQPGQMQPQQQPQFQMQPQQQNPPPSSPPSSLLQGVQNLLANVLSAFR